MSTSIDNKVVEMRFDNKQFETNVQTSLSTLDKLKQSLNLTGATKGLENVNKATKNIDMAGLSTAIDTVRSRFSTLGIVGVTALTNITNSAVNAGKRIVSALTIDPIKTGFAEYETQINAVQTILANTSHAGTDLQDVNRVLDELNEYADKTIYNFTQMTRNIGTFTAAGVDLETSASAIQGIANLAAVSGSTSQQASNAMYQLSQAIANGKVNLQDWNSVVNAGMGGKVFQDALIKTAAAMKGVTEETFRAENVTGSFRESINSQSGTGWLTSDVLVKTLSQFTMAAEEGTEQWEAYKKSLMAEGYTDAQAEEIIKMANTATDAATKVKTFTQLWDTLKESAQSGWTQTWEIMIGDFEEAKEFLTEISDTIGGMLSESANARNELFSGAFSSGWKQLLGAGIPDEEEFINTIKSVSKEHGVNFDKMSKDNETFEKTLSRGLKEGKINADMLTESVTQMATKMSKMSEEELQAAGYTKEHVAQMKELSNGLKDGSVSMDEFIDKMTKPSGRENLIESLRNTFEGLMSVVKPIKEAFKDVFPSVTSDQLYKLTENLKNFTEGLTLSESASDKIKMTFEGLFSVCDLLAKGIQAVVQSLSDLAQSEGVSKLADFMLDIAASTGEFFTSINKGFDTDGLTGGLSAVVTGISNLLSGFVDSLGSFTDATASIGDAIGGIIDKIWSPLEKVFNWLTENVSISDVFAGLAGGGIFMAMKNFSDLIDDFSDTLSKMFGKDGLPKWKDVFVETLSAIHDSLTAFTTGLKIWSIVGIATAITMLSSALKTISEVEIGDVAKSITAIGIMMGLLVGSLRLMSKTLVDLKPKGFVSASVSMMAMAESINILADAMTKISQLTLIEISKGLFGIGIALLEFSIAMRIISKSNGVSLSNSVAMLALAESCKKIADALSKFGKMSWDEIGRGLTAMGGALAEFVAVIAVLGKVGGFKSILGSAALLIAVQSLDTLAAGLKDFGSMNWDEIGRGLTAMGGALSEVGIVTGALGKISGFSSIFGAGAILIVVQGLDEIANALQEFGSMSWGEIGRGLSAMGGALLELGVVTGALGYLTGIAGIFGAATIWTAVQGLDDLASALKDFGSMSWDEIGRGLTGMGGALLELGVVTGALGYLTGIAGILGAATIWVGVQCLSDLADSFQKFGEMSWDEIGRGLTGMGGALLELGVVSGALGYLTNIAGVLGAATIWVAVQGLDDLAEALKKFGSMSWDEIGRGLSAMGGALGEIALGSFLSTLSGIGAATISELAEPLGVLADSLKKWKDVTVPENLGWQLASLANGILSFTFGGLGASALATTAPAIGTMADSIKKWKNVTVPEGLPEQISSLRKALSGFWSKGISADVLATAAPAIGTMAESIKKWSGVTLPENIGEQMESISKGIKSFSFAFVGGWSLNAVTGPLGDLAEDVKKWNGITVSSTIDEDLSALAKGVKAFSWAFMGGLSLTTIVGPLGNLAADVKKWNGVTIPSDIEEGLSGLADGVKSFSWAFVGGMSLTAIVGPLGDLAASVKKWSDVTIPDTLSTSISSFADSIKKLSEINYDSIVSGLHASSSSFSKLGIDTVNSMSTGITESGSRMSSALSSVMDNAVSTVNSKRSSFNTAGVETMTSFINGFNRNKSQLVSTINSMLSSAVSTINSKYSSFYSAGSYLVTGFANGISANTYLAVARAQAMAAAAAAAAEAELDINSPSKVGYGIGNFFGMGFVNAIADYADKAYTAGSNMANSAKVGLDKTVSKINESLSFGMDTRPVISPVLDLSNVESGMDNMSNMFLGKRTLSVNANGVAHVTTSMQRLQNRQNDNELLSAISRLQKGISDMPRNVYQINGVSYAEGSDVANAIKTIVNATKLDGRS